MLWTGGRGGREGGREVEPTYRGDARKRPLSKKEATNTVPDIQKYIIVVIRDGI